MHEFWTIPTVIMMYTRSQNYTNMVVGKHGIQTFEAGVVLLLLLLLLFDVFGPHKCTLLFLDKWFVQIYLNVDYVCIHWLNVGSPLVWTLLS